MKYHFKSLKSQVIRTVKNNPICSRIHGIYTDIVYRKTNADHQKTFKEIYESNHWSDEESVSGPGSNSIAAKNLIERLPKILKKYDIKSLIDAPCGDFRWMSKVNLLNIDYLGGDIVQDLIDRNQKSYGAENINFKKLDICNDELPHSDLMLVRDCLVHMNHDLVRQFLLNIRKSNVKYLLVTSFPLTKYNHDIYNGNWWPMNMEIHPFNLPAPIDRIIEDGDEFNGQFPDKSLFLYKVSDL
jgi:hypothetical protein